MESLCMKEWKHGLCMEDYENEYLHAIMTSVITMAMARVTTTNEVSENLRRGECGAEYRHGDMVT